MLMLGEQLPAGGLLAEEPGAVIDHIDLNGNRVGQAFEAPVGEFADHPVRHHHYSHFDVALAVRFGRSDRHCGGVVVL